MKVSRLLFKLRPSLNSKQKGFLASMLGIGSGAVIYTLWQMMIPLTNDTPEYSFVTKFGIIVVSSILLWLALELQKEKL